MFKEPSQKEGEQTQMLSVHLLLMDLEGIPPLLQFAVKPQAIPPISLLLKKRVGIISHVVLCYSLEYKRALLHGHISSSCLRLERQYLGKVFGDVMQFLIGTMLKYPYKKLSLS